MKIILTILLILVAFACFSQEFDFTREYDVIPVSFDGVECQVPWTTGYNYINPTFCDIDGDGDYDLFFGSDWARVSFYENYGNNHEFLFQLETDNLVTPPDMEALSQFSNKPDFCDIDNDGDFDLFVGAYFMEPIYMGNLYYYENIGTSQNPEFNLIETNFNGIESNNNLYPFFVDIDADEDFDLFLGLGYYWTPTAGRLAFYENEGTPDSASMTLVSDFFMEIDIGYRIVPSFNDIDNDGDYDMFLGDEDGYIHYYRNDGTPEEYDFTEVTTSYQDINVGNLASPTFIDIDDDDDYDLFVGEESWGEDDQRGDIDYYENIGTPDSAVFMLITQNFVTLDIGSGGSVAFADVDDDGSTDLFIGEADGNLDYLSNIGSATEPVFTFRADSFQNVQANYQNRPCFGDLDNDDDLDLVVGKSSWTSDCVKFFINEGTCTEPNYVEHPEYEIEIGVDWPSPELIDINNDGDLDLFVGQYESQVIYYENIGTPEEFAFNYTTGDYLNTPLIEGDLASLAFGDLDNDGDYDIIRGHAYDFLTDLNSYLDFYRNEGTPYLPEFSLEITEFLDIKLTYLAEPFLTDIDTDGDLDLFVSDFCGGVSFWRNNEINSVNREPSTVNRSFTLQPCYPNPFNVVTTIPFTLDRQLPVKIMVYNQLGQNVVTLFDGVMDSGKHQVNWDAGNVSSGVYLIRLYTQTGYSESRKVMLVK